MNLKKNTIEDRLFNLNKLYSELLECKNTSRPKAEVTEIFNQLINKLEYFFYENKLTTFTLTQLEDISIFHQNLLSEFLENIQALDPIKKMRFFDWCFESNKLIQNQLLENYTSYQSNKNLFVQQLHRQIFMAKFQEESRKEHYYENASYHLYTIYFNQLNKNLEPDNDRKLKTSTRYIFNFLKDSMNDFFIENLFVKLLDIGAFSAFDKANFPDLEKQRMVHNEQLHSSENNEVENFKNLLNLFNYGKNLTLKQLSQLFQELSKSIYNLVENPSINGVEVIDEYLSATIKYIDEVDFMSSFFLFANIFNTLELILLRNEHLLSENQNQPLLIKFLTTCYYIFERIIRFDQHNVDKLQRILKDFGIKLIKIEKSNINFYKEKLIQDKNLFTPKIQVDFIYLMHLHAFCYPARYHFNCVEFCQAQIEIIDLYLNLFEEISPDITEAGTLNNLIYACKASLTYHFLYSNRISNYAKIQTIVSLIKKLSTPEPLLNFYLGFLSHIPEQLDIKWQVEKADEFFLENQNLLKNDFKEYLMLDELFVLLKIYDSYMNNFKNKQILRSYEKSIFSIIDIINTKFSSLHNFPCALFMLIANIYKSLQSYTNSDENQRYHILELKYLSLSYQANPNTSNVNWYELGLRCYQQSKRLLQSNKIEEASDLQKNTLAAFMKSCYGVESEISYIIRHLLVVKLYCELKSYAEAFSLINLIIDQINENELNSIEIVAFIRNIGNLFLDEALSPNVEEKIKINVLQFFDRIMQLNFEKLQDTEVEIRNESKNSVSRTFIPKASMTAVFMLCGLLTSEDTFISTYIFNKQTIIKYCALKFKEFPLYWEKKKKDFSKIMPFYDLATQAFDIANLERSNNTDAQDLFFITINQALVNIIVCDDPRFSSFSLSARQIFYKALCDHYKRMDQYFNLLIVMIEKEFKRQYHKNAFDIFKEGIALFDEIISNKENLSPEVLLTAKDFFLKMSANQLMQRYWQQYNINLNHYAELIDGLHVSISVDSFKQSLQMNRKTMNKGNQMLNTLIQVTGAIKTNIFFITEKDNDTPKKTSVKLEQSSTQKKSKALADSGNYPKDAAEIKKTVHKSEDLKKKNQIDVSPKNMVKNNGLIIKPTDSIPILSKSKMHPSQSSKIKHSADLKVNVQSKQVGIVAKKNKLDHKTDFSKKLNILPKNEAETSTKNLQNNPGRPSATTKSNKTPRSCAKKNIPDQQPIKLLDQSQELNEYKQLENENLLTMPQLKKADAEINSKWSIEKIHFDIIENNGKEFFSAVSKKLHFPASIIFAKCYVSAGIDNNLNYRESMCYALKEMYGKVLEIVKSLIHDASNNESEILKLCESFLKHPDYRDFSENSLLFEGISQCVFPNIREYINNINVTDNRPNTSAKPEAAIVYMLPSSEEKKEKFATGQNSIVSSEAVSIRKQPKPHGKSDQLIWKTISKKPEDSYMPSDIKNQTLKK